MSQNAESHKLLTHCLNEMNISSDKVKQATKWKELFKIEDLDEVRAILEHFVSDGYALKHQNNIDYQISINGRLFCDYGGYTQKLIDDKINIHRMKTDSILRMRNDRRLVQATFLAGFGAFALVLWEIYKYCHCGCN